MNEGNWIKLHRKLLKSLVFTNEKALKVWIYCLLRANHEHGAALAHDKKITIKPGSFMTSLRSMKRDLEMGQSTIYRYIKLLASEQMVEHLPYRDYSLVTIKKWGEYQKVEHQLVRKQERKQERKRVSNKKEEEGIRIKEIKQRNADASVGINAHGTVAKEFELFINWYNELFGKDFTATAGRQQKYKARRKVFSLELIKRACENIRQSAFHMGHNDKETFYATPDFILRSDEMVDKWKDEKNIWKK